MSALGKVTEIEFRLKGLKPIYESRPLGQRMEPKMSALGKVTEIEFRLEGLKPIYESRP